MTLHGKLKILLPALAFASIHLNIVHGETAPSESGKSIRFSEHLISDQYSYPYGIGAADLDGDGDLDLTSADCKSNDSIYWFENNGEGEFERHFIQKNDPVRLERHQIRDMNGDGHPDVVIVKNLNGHLLWFENSGTPKDGKLWKRWVITTQLPGAYDVAVADYDGDGDLDVAGSSWVLGNQFAWFENEGAASDTEWKKHLIAERVDETRGIRAADFDRDGDPDLLGTASTNPVDSDGDGEKEFLPGIVMWYENEMRDGEVEWTVHTIDSAPRPMHGEPIDMDGDGDMDVVMALGMSAPHQTQNTHQIVWYENEDPAADEKWPKHIIARDFHDGMEAVAADMDGDGDVDVVATSWRNPGRIAWFENGGDPRKDWTMHLLKDNWQSANQVIIADLNGDGRPDIAAVAEYGSNEFRWWRNEGVSE